MYNKNAPGSIQSLFNSIARRYDLTNAILSFSLHKRWKKKLVQLVSLQNQPLQDPKHHKPSKKVKPVPNASILIDLCAGTGDIAIDFLKKASHSCHAYLVDFSTEMLKLARLKADKSQFPASHTLTYIEADVQRIPLQDNVADCATMAYGIRNVKDPNQCIQEVYRTLKSGGCFGILELTRPNYRILRLGHQIYLRTFIPLVGKLITDNKQAYQYLCQSIQTFIPADDLEKLLITNGFTRTQRHTLAGGIATVIIGYK